MIKDIINIGIPSKGRLRKDVLNIFKKNKLKLISERGERDLFGSIKNKKNIKVVYLHAREIIQRLGDGSLDLGFSGFDLLKESEINIQNKISVTKKYNFGKATLVVAIPDEWIDVQTIADLEEIAFEFKDKKKKRLRVGTKYPNLTREFLFSKGVTQFKLVDSLGATETYPFTGSAEIITDITSTGETLRANNLRILKDGEILKSEACMMISKSSSKNKAIQSLVNYFLRIKSFQLIM
jgi:ATP phosphoribosyltransferase